MRLSSLIASAAVAPMLIAATQPVRLQPSSQWILNYAENSCQLIRTFGEGKTKTVLLLESEAPERMDMLAVGKPLVGYTNEIGARFLPVGGKTFKGRTAESSAGRDPAILWSYFILLPDEAIERLQKKAAEQPAKPGTRPPSIDLAERAAKRLQRKQFAEKATELEIQTRHDRPVILETGSMGEPIAMFDKCSRDSLKDWGVDPDVEDKVVRPVWAPDPRRWFNSDDYPKSLLLRGEESEVSVRVLVDASGKVTKCTSLSHFKEPGFNQITCDNFMKRAQFAPAELADGTKVPSYYTQRVVFRIGR
jgi:TonB family protein